MSEHARIYSNLLKILDHQDSEASVKINDSSHESSSTGENRSSGMSIEKMKHVVAIKFELEYGVTPIFIECFGKLGLSGF